MNALSPPGQLGLFGQASKIPFDFRRPRRLVLDARSWVEHHVGWLGEHESLFQQLRVTPAWEQRQRWMYTKEVAEPRLTAELPSLSDAPDEAVRDVGAALSKHYGVVYDSAWLNLYRDERDSTAWHGDRVRSRDEECIVPVLSLGAPRRFQLRDRKGGPSTTLFVHGGDLVVMGGRCQHDWLHCVPKETRRCGARISLNFGSSAAMRPG